MASPPICGRTTRVGRPCRLPPTAGANSCYGHLTPDELAVWTRQREESNLLWNSLFASEVRAVPAYMSWARISLGELRDQSLARTGHLQPEVMRYILLGWNGLSALREWQADRCAICGMSDSNLVIDHDHVTAKVRGLLCRSCNTLEGFGHGGAFSAYRDAPPASVLGVDEVYESPFTGRAAPQPKSTEVDLWANAAYLSDLLEK